jgi:hypothetical protein
MNKIITCSDAILSYLLDYRKDNPDFTFSLRERDSPQAKEVKRLETGQWFQGSDYIFVPLFKRGDNARKIKSIGFVVSFNGDGTTNNYIEISFKDGNFSETEKQLHNKLTEFLGIDVDKSNVGRFYFKKQEDTFDNLDYYINEFRAKALSIINELDLVNKYIIGNNDFEKSLTKTLSIRQKLNSKNSLNDLHMSNMPILKEAYQRYRESEHYKIRETQFKIVPVLKEIIKSTLSKDTIANSDYTGFIQMFKYGCTDAIFDKYLKANVPDDAEFKRLYELAYEANEFGYTGAGLNSVTALPDTSLQAVKDFLLKAFDVNNVKDANILCQNFEALNISQIRSGIFSPWLYYINPSLFPILNNSHNEFRKLLNISPTYSEAIEAFQFLKKEFGEEDLGMVDFFAHNIKKYLPQQTETTAQTIVMRHPLNQILYGPPGTGKTYNSIDKAVKIATGSSSQHAENKIVFDKLRTEGQIEFVTFHQGYSYEDFMVGIKPNIDSEDLTFKPHKGIFYNLVDRAKKNYLASKNKVSLSQSFEVAFEELIAPLEQGEEVKIPMLSGATFEITRVDGNTIRFNKPRGGNGHTLSVETLKSFVEGKREVIGLQAYYNPLIEIIKQKMISEKKSESPIEQLKNYVLIIDEINRANISKVFGELITLLEDDKRIDAPNSLAVTLPNGELNFSIPPNLYIVGTMNTADKSISLIDVALRRRFEFEGFYPDYAVLEGDYADRIALLKLLNNVIYAKKKTADYLIGHGYFMKKESIESILLKKIIPLLMEYFSGRIEEVASILKSAGYEARFNEMYYKWELTKLTALIDETPIS